MDFQSKTLALFALNVDRLSWIYQTMSGTVRQLALNSLPATTGWRDANKVFGAWP